MIDHFHSDLRNTLSLALAAAGVGVVSAYASLAFLWAIDCLYLLWIGESGEHFYTHLKTISVWHLLVLTVAGAVIVRLIIHYAMPEQRNQGPADAIAAVRTGDGVMSIKAGIVSALASVISIGSGASVGRYGPAVHLGASLGSWFAQCMRLTPGSRKTLLACGVAGAISASFSAPLAGVVFAHEVILGRFESKSILPIVISSVIASTVARIHEFDNIIFILPEVVAPSYWEYFLFALLGVIGGGLAVVFMGMMHHFIEFSRRLPLSEITKAALGGMLLGGIVLIFPQTFGLGEQLIRDALRLEITGGVLVLLVLAKLLATSISFAAGFSGGVFGPALFLGAMLGTAFGLGVGEWIETASSPAVYGVVGMGAVISRVIGAPITTILIVFELTGNYSLMTAVMASVVAGGAVARQIFPQSYFYHQLAMRGIAPDTTRAEQALYEIPVGTVKSSACVVLNEDATLAEARDQMAAAHGQIGYVVDCRNRLVGQIPAAQLFAVGDSRQTLKQLEDVWVTPPVVFTEAMSMYAAYCELGDFKGGTVPLVRDAESMHLEGVVYVSDLVDVSLQVFEKNRENTS